ncbi:MAG TPA: hypothetical protein VFQ62_17820 [Methylomirabilota bacterium]|nr:hypothetical protein [Methylomirabilota bacterium]
MKTPLAIVLSLIAAAGIVAANQLSAQTTTTSPAATSPTTAPATATLGVATVQNVVEITRAVPAGTAAVDAFTVPAGVVLVVTDILVTNTGTAAACGGAVNRSGGAAAVITPTGPTSAAATDTTATGSGPSATLPTTTEGASGLPGTSSATTPVMTTTSTGTLTQTDSTVTGPLCVPPQTTTALPLTTGIEFAGGEVVQLLNAPLSTTGGTPTAAVTPGSLAFHLRGLLITRT